MRPNRDGKCVPPGRGGYDIEIVEVTGAPVYHMEVPQAKSCVKLIPAGDGEGLPQRPAPDVRRWFGVRSRTPLVPTADEIASLPRPARVAFAARCVRRILPTIAFFWKGAPAHHLNALAEAVRVAELADKDAAPAADAAALAAYTTASSVDTPPGAAYEDAARAAMFVVADLAVVTDPDSIDNGFIVRTATEVLLKTATIDTPLTAQLRCIRRDFARLKKLAREQKWIDDTPVPPEVFGPMWPEGAEPYWAVEPPPPPAAGSDQNPVSR